MGKGMRLLVPITKIDEERRLVIGTITEEVVDKSGEMLDYASSKPYFEKWSAEFTKATNGKSAGNLRVMHTPKVAGRFTQIDFNDAEKRITGVAKVVDDEEWNKCLEGLYTAFSFGGHYEDYWRDEQGVKRFTGNPTETSLVDNPCLQTAHFELVKADGTAEVRDFKKHDPPDTTEGDPPKTEPDAPKTEPPVADGADTTQGADKSAASTTGDGTSKYDDYCQRKAALHYTRAYLAKERQ